jgi:hypothetical protein
MLFLACRNRPLFNPYFDNEFSGRMENFQAQDVRGHVFEKSEPYHL